MSILSNLRALFGTPRKTEQEEQREVKLRQLFKARCGYFKALLSANKRALVAMATLEEAAKGEQLFGMGFVRANCTTVITNVFNMVRNLNYLSDNAYESLSDRLKVSQQRISDIISPKTVDVNGPLVLPLERIGLADTLEAGGKMASLGEARQQLGQVIPPGFVITASGYRRFIEANSLQEEINRRIQLTDLSQLDAVFALSSSLQQLIIASPIPEDLERAILEQYAALEKQQPGVRLAVRSSAIGEDAHGTSFAGQYHSELNVTGDILLDTYKEVVASKYGVTAMSYRANRGIPDDEVPMCVGCLRMVEALAGGVAYSSDPMNAGRDILINAVPGLPKAVVDGSAEVDVFRVSREKPHRILDRDVPVKQSKLESAPGEGIVRKALPPEEGAKPCLSDERILQIAEAALAFEDFYGQAQDVEWAFGPEGHLVILQSRALPGREGRFVSEPLPENVELLLEGGVSASSGVGAGEVCIVRRNADMLSFPSGAVLVVEQAHARWAPVLGRASALVSEYGGTAGHLASVAREYGVPALFGVENALKTLEKKSLVTVDADSRRVLAGRVESVLARTREPKPRFENSPVFQVLRAVIQEIVPLNLLDPDSPDFAPEHCRSMHDITRFCHEKAVEEMFRMDDALFSGRYGKQLKYKGSKLQYFVVDIEEGFCAPVEGRYVELDDICCPPMHALWDGMLAIPWAGPVGTTGRGFLALVAESAGNPELEITSSSTRLARNYFMVDREYCNLQASFGYHFCTVEANAGEAEQENYVNFHFKGGAANLSRRLLRVNALADVLSENGFIVELRQDALSARAEEMSAPDVLELLLVVGYLIIHTRQMDAALSGENSRVAFADSLRAGISRVLARPDAAGGQKDSLEKR